MSTAVAADERARSLDRTVYGALALGSVGALTASYLSILYHVTDVVGGVRELLAVTAVAVVAGAVLSRRLRVGTAVWLAAAFTAVGYAAYALAIPDSYLALLVRGKMLSDTLTLLQGLSILRITRADVWAIGYAPGPVFLSTYLALRRRYALAAAVGAAALGLFVLTGDAGSVPTLAGVLGAAGAAGFGDLERHDGRLGRADVVAVVLGLMVVVPATLSLVPAGAAGTPTPGGGSTTVEGTLVGATDRVSIVGSIDLSPRVRYTVTSDRPTYWRVSAYDRYTGNDWIRTGSPSQFPGTLAPPPGPSRTVRQTYRAETRVASMPAAWRPVDVSGIGDQRVQVTEMGSLVSASPLSRGETYSVLSAVPEYSRARLQAVEADYPDSVVEKYAQLPESTPERLVRHTDRLTAGADGPYEAAVRIETWLERNKGYSLSVDRPDDHIADSFVFEMRAGYCTYFATAMVAMLRTQGIPARFVAGYATGQRVARDRWVVRGLDSHAWVEVYFPGVGWVRFDPTPGGPRAEREGRELERARAADVPNVDTQESAGGEWTPTPSGGFAPNATPGGRNPGLLGTATPTAPPLNGTPGGLARGPGAGGDTGGPLPPPEILGLWLVGIIGAVAGARRFGLTGRLYREVWLRWQPRVGDPGERVERAYRRMEHLLARRHRPRRPGETPRRYLENLWAAGVDERCRRVGELYERAAYGGRARDGDAEEAVETVDEMVREGVRFGGLFDRGR